MKSKMHEHTGDILRNVLHWGVTTVAAITAAQQEIEWGLRIASFIVAIVASGYTIWSTYRKNNQK